MPSLAPDILACCPGMAGAHKSYLTLACTLERELSALWTVVVEEGVEPTKSRAERALRCAVPWCRMMQGTYNEKGDR